MKFQKALIAGLLSVMMIRATVFTAPEIFAQGGVDLMDILPVTDRIMMVHIRDGHIDTCGIGQNISHNKVYHDPTDLDKALDKANYYVSSSDDGQYSSPLNPVNIGRKSKGWEYQDAWNPPPYIWQHWIYIELPHALQHGHTYTVELDNITGNRTSFTLEFDFNRTRSETVRVNMVGFPENGPKFAYLSHWMGDFNTSTHQGGGLSLYDRAGSEFRVIDYATGETAYTGTIAKRMDKNTRETASADFPSGNYTNADVWECDFSSLTKPGEYIVAVDGIGRSFPFEIGNDITREAYYYAMKGLFWQRQGIVLEVKPDSIRPRGHHPDDIVWRFDPEWHGQGYDVSDFNTDSPRVYGVWGHYYDAGDWDGYVTHNTVTAHLLLLYDLAPEGFIDGDVGNRYKLHQEDEWIEEGKSGKPDLLDEAVWLLDYNRRARHILKDYGGTGGVPGYVGRDAIPGGNNITSWMDTREWYISGNHPEATFLYAGNAAYYALNLNRFHELKGGSGNHPEYEEWMTEAVESYVWADDNTGGSDAERRAQGYAATVLYRATGETAYQSRFASYWAWEPQKTHGEWSGVNLWAVSAMQLAVLPDEHNGLNKELRNNCRNSIRTRADSKAGDIFANGFRSGMEYHQFMQLGGFNTPRLTVLATAHRLTGDQKYLEAMQHAVSYVLGGNQLNMSYLSGLGERSDQWIFQPNAYLVSNKNSMVYTPENYIGQTSYFGATGLASDYWFTQSKFAEYFSRQAAYPPVDDDTGVLITAVAYSDRGRRSLPSKEGERNVIITLDKSVTGVTLSDTLLLLAVDETATLVATVHPSYAENPVVTWESHNDKVAAVDQEGLVTAVAEGTTIIRVIADEGGFTAECEVIVSSATLSEIINPAGFRVYPNPLRNGSLTILPGEDHRGNLAISVFNTTGTLIKRVKAPGYGDGITFEPGLPAGIYIIIIETNGASFYRKLQVL